MEKNIDYSIKTGKVKVCVGKNGKSLGELDWPRGVAVDHESSNIYVSLRDIAQVLLFNGAGEFLHTFKTMISRNFYLCIVNGVIFMSNFYNHSISIYNLTGDFITTFGQSGSKIGEFGFPQGIAIDKELNKLFICDRDNSRVQVFGEFYIRAIKSTEKSPLKLPRDVKYSSQKLYVMDLGEFWIKIYSSSYPYTIQNSIIKSDIERSPYYFALDCSLNIILSNYLSSSIEVYSPDGDLIHTIATKGNDPGYVSSPNGIAITQKGNIVSVCVAKNTGLLQVF